MSRKMCFSLSSQSQLNPKFYFIAPGSKAHKEYKINISTIFMISTISGKYVLEGQLTTIKLLGKMLTVYEVSNMLYLI